MDSPSLDFDKRKRFDAVDFAVRLEDRGRLGVLSLVVFAVYDRDWSFLESDTTASDDGRAVSRSVTPDNHSSLLNPRWVVAVSSSSSSPCVGVFLQVDCCCVALAGKTSAIRGLLCNRDL